MACYPVLLALLCRLHRMISAPFENTDRSDRCCRIARIGIDRLCMMLLGQEPIRGVILSPQLKSK
jgi:elongation factor P--beta-lysine ligase